MLPSTLPLFPLPSVVLFPNMLMPLYIFEPRYQQMVADALAGDRLIGMVLLQAADTELDVRAPIYDVGCAGLITHVERLPEGHFNITLRGFEKFRLIGEDEPSPDLLYRRALVTPIGEDLVEADRAELRHARRRLEVLLAPSDGDPHDLPLPHAMDDEDLVNALAQYLQLEPIERQALLERSGPLARCRALIELLEMKALDRHAIGPVTRH
jgi:Lon protease-like protein